jgi:hypothetical protein
MIPAIEEVEKLLLLFLFLAQAKDVQSLYRQMKQLDLSLGGN